ncbi:MAG: recombinase family protein [Desulfamplus sp.]|nr:recombinase family protein [Desulfamplus sp.]
MSKTDHPTGIIETMLESIEENNHRLDTLESKIDRIWELVTKLASPAEVKPEAISPPEIAFDDEVVEDAQEPELEETKTAPSIPDWQDKEAFKKYTADLIFEMKNKGMTLKAIAEELNGMGLKTRSGKDKWSFGMVNSVLQQGEQG